MLTKPRGPHIVPDRRGTRPPVFSHSRSPSPCPVGAMASTTANPLAGPSALRDLIRPQFHQNNFAEESWVKTELGIKLDKGLSHPTFFRSYLRS